MRFLSRYALSTCDYFQHSIFLLTRIDFFVIKISYWHLQFGLFFWQFASSDHIGLHFWEVGSCYTRMDLQFPVGGLHTLQWLPGSHRCPICISRAEEPVAKPGAFYVECFCWGLAFLMKTECTQKINFILRQQGKCFQLLWSCCLLIL